MTTLEIIELIVIAAVALGLSIFYLVKAIKNGWLKLLKKTIEEAIHTAEESGKDGPEKFAYVMKQVELKCSELGIPYDILKKLFTKVINTIIANHNVVEKGHE